MGTGFHPTRRTLLGPGPSDVPPRVLEALSRPTLGHLDPEFVGLMDDVKRLLQLAFQTRNEVTFAVSGPGSAGMEACVVNLVEPGDTVIVGVNGVFGGRLAEIARRAGATVVTVEHAWGQPVEVEKVAAALSEHPEASLLAFVHAETSTGVRSDAEALARLGHEHGCLVVVDAVTSLGGTEVAVDAWGIDAAYAGSQKCLSCVPGLSPVTFSPRAMEHIRARHHPVQSWFLDVTLLTTYWGGGGRRAYHHTAPVNQLYALHEALLMLEEEGLEAAWARHRRHHEALVAGLEAMGLELAVPEPHRLPQLNAVRVPDGVDEAEVRRFLLAEFGIEIGAGLGELAGKIWRIGLMGYSARRANVLAVLTGLRAALAAQGWRGGGEDPVAAARRTYAGVAS